MSNQWFDRFTCIELRSRLLLVGWNIETQQPPATAKAHQPPYLTQVIGAFSCLEWNKDYFN